MAIVRLLEEADAEAYRQFRCEALEESPLAFGASPATDFSSSPERVREQLRPGSPVVVIGAFEGALLAGMVGLLQARHAKAQHKVQLWRRCVTTGR